MIAIDNHFDVVTGSSGYTGRHITSRLLSKGRRVRSLTGHTARDNPFGPGVTFHPFNFDNPRELVKSLEGAQTLYNTYWVRFPRGQVNYDIAVENTKKLVDACIMAGVKRIVHISITNADSGSPLPYFRGKGQLEEYIAASGMSHAIIRPTVLFGDGDVLINNIAWMLRRFPFFAMPGNGDYPVQPVYVGDLADLAVSSAERNDNVVFDAAGPELYSFKSMVRMIARRVGSRSWIIEFNPRAALFMSRLVGALVRDVVLTEDEIRGLIGGMLFSRKRSTGKTKLSRWLDLNSDGLGLRYASELKRHYR